MAVRRSTTVRAATLRTGANVPSRKYSDRGACRRTQEATGRGAADGGQMATSAASVSGRSQATSRRVQ